MITITINTTTYKRREGTMFENRVQKRLMGRLESLCGSLFFIFFAFKIIIAPPKYVST
jgi:hypothetical protein